MPTDINRLNVIPPASNGLRKTKAPFSPSRKGAFRISIVFLISSLRLG